MENIHREFYPEKGKNNNITSTTDEPFPRGKALLVVETPIKSVSADTLSFIQIIITIGGSFCCTG